MLEYRRKKLMSKAKNISFDFSMGKELDWDADFHIYTQKTILSVVVQPLRHEGAEKEYKAYYLLNRHPN